MFYLGFNPNVKTNNVFGPQEERPLLLFPVAVYIFRKRGGAGIFMFAQSQQSQMGSTSVITLLSHLLIAQVLSVQRTQAIAAS